MDFRVPEETQTMLDMINEFVDKELIPLEAEYLTKGTENLDEILKQKQQKVKDMELWAPLHPKDVGGMGLKLTQSALVFEALGRSQIGRAHV